MVLGSVKRKRGLTYHEVIWGRPLFGLPPHAGKKKKKKEIVRVNPATIQTVVLIVQKMFLFDFSRLILIYKLIFKRMLHYQ